MIGFQTRIFLCTDDTDMRKSFGSLVGIIRSSMHLDPQSGFLFIFKNKRGDRIKCVFWDSDGFAMFYNYAKFQNMQSVKEDRAARSTAAEYLRC